MVKWKWILNYRGYYKVSSSGKIKSVDRTHLVNGGVRFLKGRILKGTLVKEGYLRVGLTKHGVTNFYFIHQLVLLMFVGPCPEGMECRHFPDRDKANNNLENIQWGTKRQNTNDRVTQGVHLFGELHGGSKLTTSKVKKIRSLRKNEKLTVKEIKERLKLNTFEIFSQLSGTTGDKRIAIDFIESANS
jgi:hypothetical protein